MITFYIDDGLIGSPQVALRTAIDFLNTHESECYGLDFKHSITTIWWLSCPGPNNTKHNLRISINYSPIISALGTLIGPSAF